MGQLSLQPGERQKIISQPGPNKEYNLDVEGADVFLSHRKGLEKQEGKRVRPGDRVEIENLQGKPVYALNPKGNTSEAVLSLNEAAFGLIFQPRAIQATIQSGPQDEATPATDDFTEATGNSVDISNGGNVVESLTPPGRSNQVSIHAEGTAQIEVKVRWNNTEQTFSGTTVREVLPVYFISDGIDVGIQDTSNGSNTVNYDIAVV
jgi:hypothetical protein